MHSVLLEKPHAFPNNVGMSIYERPSTIVQLPDGYRVNKPLLAYTNPTGLTTAKKTKLFALNWLVHDPSIEVIDTEKGLLQDGTPSRLCKMSFFSGFHALWHRMDPLTRCSETIPDVYNAAKQAVGSYHGAKKQFAAVFKTVGFGQWLGQPSEFNEFPFVNKAAEETTNGDE